MEIRVNTKGYGGRTLHKSVRVVTNDPNNPEIELSISGPVASFASIAPTTIYLSKDGKEGEATGSVRITPSEAYPFKIIRTSATASAKFSHTLEEFKNGKEHGWILTVTDPEPTGRYAGTVYLNTDSKIKPRLEVRVYANFTEQKPTRIKRLPPKDDNQLGEE
ncbi:MAG: hypothetical protein JEZ02_04280 [Desulfatibacillum sp.]|nr:hypothetical protein [Desulfatibacillum sp.]